MSKRSQSSYGLMSLETMENVIRRVLDYAEGSCMIAYQGGEPSLSGLSFFEKTMEFQKKYNRNHVKIENAFQTNGYHFDKKWMDFLKKNNFLVGISLDGGPKIHDRYRKTPDGKGSFYRVMETVELLKKADIDFNILSVVNGNSASKIKKIYEFYRKNQLNYLQFIPCLDPLGESPGKREYSLLPEVYGRFLIELFQMWYRDWLQGMSPYIRQFENYISILLNQAPESCDMRGICGRQYVVESDGSVYPCDFYVLDRYCLGNLNYDPIEKIDEIRGKIGFIQQSEQKEMACMQCQYYGVCRGGCRRTRQEGIENHQYFCESYKAFFEACLPQMMKIAECIRRTQ
jgi:uncharacterized protein